VQRIRIARAEKILDLTKAHVGPGVSPGLPEQELQLLISAATYCGPAEPVCRPQHLKPEYRVPRFVAEGAREAGAHGLLVPSTKEGTNLVLFTWRDEDVSPEGEPQKIAADERRN
jgi:hypothetical protein